MKRIMAVTAVVLVALLVLGLGFARWFDTLYVATTVNTGSVDVQFSPPTTSDNEPPNKDYSFAVAEIVDDVLFISVNNAYPCITYTCQFDIDNVGTIPVHITALMDEAQYSEPFPGTIVWEWFRYDSETGDEVPIQFPVQVHPRDNVYGRVKIHMYNRWPLEGPDFIEALQDHTYQFAIPIDAGQYNEDLVL